MWKVIRGTIAYIPVMYPVLLVLVIDGLSLAFYSSEIPHLFPDDTDKDILNKLAGLAVISMGLGSTIGGYLCGIIADKKNNLFSGTTGFLGFIFSCLVVLGCLFWPSIWLTITAAFFWGYSLFYIESWMYIVCSRHYQGKAEAYSVNKQLHSLFYLIAQIAIFLTDNNLPLTVIVAVLAVLAVPALVMIRKLPPASQQ
jgi:predicted MFS family arabinose efflux permease